MKRILIIILNWNSYINTIACIESLRIIDNKDHDILVVDNNSDDNSITEIKKKYPSILLIENSVNSGYTGGNNVGLKYSLKNEYSYSIILNNDVIIKEHDFIKNTISHFQQNKNVGIIGYNIIDSETQISAPSIKPHLFYRLLYKRISKNTSKDSTIYVHGCAIAIKNNSIKLIGLLDENLFMYLDEIDYCLRIAKAGKSISILSNTNVLRKNDNKNNAKYVIFYKARNSIYLTKKYYSFFQIVVNLPILIYFLLTQMYRVQPSFSNYFVFLKGILYGIQSKTGLYSSK